MPRPLVEWVFYRIGGPQLFPGLFPDRRLRLLSNDNLRVDGDG